MEVATLHSRLETLTTVITRVVPSQSPQVQAEHPQVETYLLAPLVPRDHRQDARLHTHFPITAGLRAAQWSLQIQLVAQECSALVGHLSGVMARPIPTLGAP